MSADEKKESTEEAALVQAVQSGDEEAFAVLVHLFQKRLYGIMSGWERSGPILDDLVQETFVKVFRHIGRFRGEAKLSTWIHRIAVNTARDHRKKEGRRKKNLDALEAERLTESARTDEHEDNRMDLERAMADLPEELRTSLLLVAREGMTHREAADVLGCSVGTVSWRVHEARESLRKLLKAGTP